MSAAVAAPVLVWFRQDLRLDDNPALLAAVALEAPLVPVYIHAPKTEGEWAPGPAAAWWLERSLARHAERLRAVGSDLVFRRGDPAREIPKLVRETRAQAVCWNRRHEPEAVARDQALESALNKAGVRVEIREGALLFSPDETAKSDGSPYKVYTPFWKALLSREAPGEPLPAPTRLAAPARWPTSVGIESLGLDPWKSNPASAVSSGWDAAWTPGEAGGEARLSEFLDGPAFSYAARRNRPDRIDGVSRLSPHLRFGEISPRRVWHALRQRAATRPESEREQADEFLRQLGWREFAYSLLRSFPETATEPLRPEFARFPWATNARAVEAWREGRTGYPLVDAGMRELRETGWMHNRARMIAASFLVKHLRVHWLVGARWFWERLVDADLANNTFGWQWCAGCGADAAPYFRIFNPTIQAAKFDPDGEYVRRWVPELARLDTPALFTPWKAAPATLRSAGVALGKDYPRPLVDHATAREQALEAYKRLSKNHQDARQGR